MGQGSVVSERRGGGRLPARDARAEGRRAEPHDVPAVPGRPRRARCSPARRASWCSSAPTSRWRSIRRCCARSARRCRRRWRTAAAGSARDGTPGIPAMRAEQVPDFFSGCFGLGSRDLQPGDIVAAVDNMLPGGARPPAVLPRHRVHSRRDADSRSSRSGRSSCSTAIPTLKELSLAAAAAPNLLPKGSTAVRIHSVGGWGAITMGKNLAMTAFELFGLHIKANPKYGSEKKGQPTTFYAVLAHEPVLLNCELKHVDVVLSPDPNVFRHSDPLAGLADGGVFVIQSDLAPGRVLADAARAGARDHPRAQHHACTSSTRSPSRGKRRPTSSCATACRARRSSARSSSTSPLLAARGARPRRTAVRGRPQAVQEEVRPPRRDGGRGQPPRDPPRLRPGAGRGSRRRSSEHEAAGHGAAHSGAARRARGASRAWAIPAGSGSRCARCAPWDRTASPIRSRRSARCPAATGAVRDMSGVRIEMPAFIAEKCTGCGQCWTQCPDSAIPGLVNSVEEILAAAIDASANGDAVRAVEAGGQAVGEGSAAAAGEGAVARA